jgi:ABC-type sugar transport system permease subunit
VSAAPLPPLRPRSSLLYRARLLTILYALVLPTFVGVLCFTYLPNIEVVKYAFYRWDGADIKEFRGLDNFKQAFGADPLFWNSFKLVGILLIANLFKMWPAILVAIALHRLASQRWQYAYRVMFVVPMVIPGLVWLLIWKTFFTSGMLNDLLVNTGAMRALDHLDSKSHGLPAIATALRTAGYAWDASRPLLSTLLLPVHAIGTVFGGAWGCIVFGLALLVSLGGIATMARRWVFWGIICCLGAAFWGWTGAMRGIGYGAEFSLDLLLDYLRMPVLVLAALAIGTTLARDRIDGPVWQKRAAIACIAIGGALVLLGEVWTSRLGQFVPLADGRDPSPAWLGNSNLIIPSLILWGFPWVGTVGVLIYLAGLQSISTEVYEAADLDGVGFFGKIFRIEIPLIMSQVRINLIFMTIGTLTDYAFYLLLLGRDGGPGGAGMVPGLYMYNKAFNQSEFGYACTLGMCMFAIVLALTIFYQKYVKVEK